MKIYKVKKVIEEIVVVEDEFALEQTCQELNNDHDFSSLELNSLSQLLTFNEVSGYKEAMKVAPEIFKEKEGKKIIGTYQRRNFSMDSKEIKNLFDKNTIRAVIQGLEYIESMTVGVNITFGFNIERDCIEDKDGNERDYITDFSLESYGTRFETDKEYYERIKREIQAKLS